MLSSKISVLAALMGVEDVEVILAHTRGVIDAAKGFFELIIMSTARQVGEAPEECILSSLSAGCGPATIRVAIRRH